MLRVHVENEGVRLAVEIAPNLPPARFERDALAQTGLEVEVLLAGGAATHSG